MVTASAKRRAVANCQGQLGCAKAAEVKQDDGENGAGLNDNLEHIIAPGKVEQLTE